MKTQKWTIVTVIGIALLIGITAGCAPKTGMVRTTDGAAGHSAANDPNVDTSYAADDSFALDNTEVSDPYAENPVRNKPARQNDTDLSIVRSSAPDQGDSVDGVGGDDFFQTGMASWYGREFNGKKTASGEKFDMYDLTAAHRTLPLGTVILVKNLDNGKTVRVRINDRGPFKGKRILDLSYASAKKIGMIADGEAMVGIKVLGTGSQDYADDAAADVSDASEARDTAVSVPVMRGISLQTGAFYSKKNADKLRDRIADVTGREEVSVIFDGEYYKVLIGDIGSTKEASRIKRALADENIESFVVE